LPDARTFPVCALWQSLQVTLRVHLALQERPPGVHLVTLLAVGVVEGIGEERRAIVIEERFAGFVLFRNLAASRVTLCAYLDLSLGCARL
jgi:hypothetical protein